MAAHLLISEPVSEACEKTSGKFILTETKRHSGRKRSVIRDFVRKRTLIGQKSEQERRLERVCECEKRQEKHCYTEGVMRMAAPSSRELHTLAVSRQGTRTSRCTLFDK